MASKDTEAAQVHLSMQVDVQAIQVAIASGDLPLEQGKQDLEQCKRRYGGLLSQILQEAQA